MIRSNRILQYDFRFLLLLAVAVSLSALITPNVFAGALSPETIAASPDGKTLFIAERTGERIELFDVDTGEVRDTISVPAEPTGLAVSPDGETLYVTCGVPKNCLCVIGIKSKKITSTIKTGPGACSPVVRSDGTRVYVCNRYSNTVSVVDPGKRKVISSIAVGRDPIAAALTPDDSFLLVANQLPEGRADADTVAASVHIIHAQGLQTVAAITLPNGSNALKDICVSPDGCYAFVPHILARFQMPTTQLERGWMNTNALTVIDIQSFKRLNTVLLDNIDRGAANPWGAACSPDGHFLCVTHAGTHELSLIDLPALIEKLESAPRYAASGYGGTAYSSSSASSVEIPNDLTYLNDLRRRIKLKGNGPRDVAVVGNKAYVSHYFSGNVNAVDLTLEGRIAVRDFSLGETGEMTKARWGEKLFHDASICFQGWQSCSSCHPDVRVDGLNWDLLNDGIGNPKNTKSLLLSHVTSPAMSTGIRDTAEMAVRSGIKHILFAVRPEEEAEALDAFLSGMKPIPSPLLNRGKLQSKAKRGKKIFFSQKTACASCHTGPNYTDLRSYDVGTKGPLDRRETFDNPMLIELWRSGPYLHDGRAATMRDVITTWNPDDRHGVTSHLTEDEIANLEAFLLSL